MNCKNCRGKLHFVQGIGICDSCGSRFEPTGAYENTEIFIAYLETDVQGRRTADSIVAEELYRKLDSAKIQTFYERISASDLADDTLEQALHQAINQAKIVLLVGCDPSHFSAILKEYGPEFTDKTILPVYSNMNAYDLPQELQKLQAMNYESVGASAGLTQRILTLLGREDELDVMQITDQAQKKRRMFLVLGIIAALLLLLAGAGTFIFFKMLPDIRQEKDYTAAVTAYEEKRFADALLGFLEHADYKDSKSQIFKFFSQYNGYYKTTDGKLDLFLNIDNDLNAVLEVNVKNDDGQTTTIEETVLIEETKIQFTYTDNNRQTGSAVITFQNNGLTINIPNAGKEAQFLLTDKTDRTVGNTLVSKDLLVKWLNETKTAKEIQEAGYELVLEKMILTMEDGGGKLFWDLPQYKIKDTDIQLVFGKSLDPIRTMKPGENGFNYRAMYFSEKDAEDYEIIAVCAPAGLLLPNEIGQTTDITQFEENLLYTARLSSSRYSDHSPFIPSSGCWFISNSGDDERGDHVWGTKTLTNNDRIILSSKAQLGNTLWNNLLYEKAIYAKLAEKESIKTLSTYVMGASNQRVLIRTEYNDSTYYAILENKNCEIIWELHESHSEEDFYNLLDLLLKEPDRFKEFVTKDDLAFWKDQKRLPEGFEIELNEPSSKTMYVTANGALNMRAEPNTDSEILVAIPTGEAVTVISVDGEWAHVQFDDKTGYCSLQYLSEKQPS